MPGPHCRSPRIQSAAPKLLSSEEGQGLELLAQETPWPLTKLRFSLSELWGQAFLTETNSKP